jgi:hypothetical protein
VCVSGRLHGTTRLLLAGFSLNLILEDFSKICPENSSFIKISQEYCGYFTSVDDTLIVAVFGVSGCLQSLGTISVVLYFRFDF